jgi:hypothetical protein
MPPAAVRVVWCCCCCCGDTVRVVAAEAGNGECLGGSGVCTGRVVVGAEVGVDAAAAMVGAIAVVGLEVSCATGDGSVLEARRGTVVRCCCCCCGGGCCWGGGCDGGTTVPWAISGSAAESHIDCLSAYELSAAKYSSRSMIGCSEHPHANGFCTLVYVICEQLALKPSRFRSGRPRVGIRGGSSLSSCDGHPGKTPTARPISYFPSEVPFPPPRTTERCRRSPQQVRVRVLVYVCVWEQRCVVRYIRATVGARAISEGQCAADRL